AVTDRRSPGGAMARHRRVPDAGLRAGVSLAQSHQDPNLLPRRHRPSQAPAAVWVQGQTRRRARPSLNLTGKHLMVGALAARARRIVYLAQAPASTLAAPMRRPACQLAS